MYKGYRIFAIFLAAMLLLGITAKAAGGMAADDPVKKASVDSVAPENSVIDEVIWVVGDEPILKSDVEAMRLQGEAEGVKFRGNPDFSIPEQLAVQKLFVHQAQLDSIQVSESDVAARVDEQINRWIQLAGSKEKLEEWRGQSVAEMRSSLHDDFKNTLLVQNMRRELVKDVKVTPSDVRRYFSNMPKDSIPMVPTEVEVEIITRQPKISQSEINRVKDQLRDFTRRVTSGETTFATLARLYSEDPVSALQGGEMDYMSRGMLDPAFANVAFSLTDPKKISKIVETEFGYHIIQLVDKRGDKIKVRHILLRPKVTQLEIDSACTRLDSIAADIRKGKFSFEDAATYVSDDKDTRSNHGLMAYTDVANQSLTSRFQMKDLPTEIQRQVATMKVGEISKAFSMINNKGKTVAAIIKLKDKIPAHKATITEDYQVMKNLVLEKEREKVINDWIVEKIKHTYVSMKPRYRQGQYEYQGWVK